MIRSNVTATEPRCAVCLDTASKSQRMDGDLDCNQCDATDKRLALRKHLAQFTAYPDQDVAAWAAYLFAQRMAVAEGVLRDGVEQAQPVVPEGWKVVPVRPTHEMVRAACDAMGATQSVMLAIEKAPMPPFVGALKFDPARLNELIQNATNAAFEAGEWREGDEGENIYQLIPKLDAAKDKLVHHIASLAAPQPAAVPVAAQPVGVMTEEQIHEMWRKLCAGGKSFGKGVGVRHIVRAVEAAKSAPVAGSAAPSGDLIAAAERMRKAHIAAKVPAKLPAHAEALEYQCAVQALISAATKE